jgi:iron complex outermembrane receptor protein
MRVGNPGLAVLLFACAVPAWAQEPGAAPEASAAAPATTAATPAAVTPAEADPQAEAVTLDAVEVTALRRKEKLQNVPVAVTAFTRDQVESRGIQRIDDLNSLAPGLQISRTPANTTISQITIRGSSQINPAIYWDPAVGLYLDGVYVGKSQGSIFDVVDLVGVEVLRGPQGTLYGRNTIAGTINLQSRVPSGMFGGSAAVEFGNFNARVQRASLDLPRLGFADMTLGVRSERRDGWVETTPTSPVSELNNRHSDGLHFATYLDITDDVEGQYRFDFNDIDQTNNYLQLYRSDDPTLAAYVSQQRQTQADINAPSLERSRVQGHSFTLSWNTSDSNTLKSITGYRKVKWTDFLDLDGSPMQVAHTKRFTDYQQFSEDLQITGRTGSLFYTGGIFYFTDDGYTNNPQTFYSGALNFDSRYGTSTRAWAGYGQLDWKLLDPLTLSAGLRYTRERKELDRVLGVSTVPGSVPDGSPLPVEVPPPGGGFVYYVAEGFKTPGETFNAVTPMVSVAWRPGANWNLYARYAEGFKSGGYNGEYSNLQDTPDDGDPATQNDNQTATNTPFRPEDQKSIELGLKTSFFDGRTLLNAAVFRNKLNDLQISTFSGQGAAASTISNAGKATVHGVELESAVIPFEGTQLRANYAYLKAEYDVFMDGGANVADNRAFVHAPRRSYNLVLDSRLLRMGWGSLRVVLDYAWTDSFYTYPYQLQPDPNPPGQQKQEAENSKVQAYGLFNARLALTEIRLGNTSYAELAFWGRNLTDNATANNFIDFGPGAFQNLTVVNFVEPRAYGVAAILHW